MNLILAYLLTTCLCAMVSVSATGGANMRGSDKRRSLQPQHQPRPRGRGQLPTSGFLFDLKLFEKYAGFEMKIAVDAGANRGEFTHTLKRFSPRAKILAVEGNKDQVPYLKRSYKEYLGDGTVEFEIALLGKETGEEVTFYNNPDGHTGNSIYREVSKHFQDGSKNLVAEKRKLETLDDLLARKGYGCPDLVKLDTQGAELDIIKGSPKTFACTKVVLFEMSLLRYNFNAPLASELIAYMHNIGFDLYDIVERHAATSKDGERVQLQIDGLFVRRDLGMIDKISKATLQGR